MLETLYSFWYMSALWALSLYLIALNVDPGRAAYQENGEPVKPGAVVILGLLPILNLMLLGGSVAILILAFAKGPRK